MVIFNIRSKVMVITAALLVVGAGIAAVWWLYLPHEKSRMPQLSNPVIPGLKMAIGRMKQSASSQGNLEWDLEAANARYLEESNQMLLEMPEVVFYMKENRRVRLTADQGLLNTQTNDIEASGSVVVSSDHYRMSTERMIYRHDTRIISSQTPVTVRSEAEQITADTMEIDLDKQRVRMTGNVKARFSSDILISPE